MTNEEIKTINDAMSWIACVSEIKDWETLTRASESRERIHKRLLADNKEIAQHFDFVSLAVLKSVKNNPVLSMT